MREEVIGDCRLILGDCREVLPSLSNIKVVVTDPPYLVTSGGFGALEGGFGGWIKDSYDNKGAIVTCDLDWPDWLNLIPAILSPDAHVYIFSNDRNLARAQSAAEASGLQFHRLLIWDKKTALPGRWYQQTCEFILFMRKGKAYMINNPSSKSLHSIFQRDESCHPTEKPVQLCQLYVENSSSAADTVCDPFMGSGTTGVACANLGRSFVGVEIEEKFFDIACARIEKSYRNPALFSASPRSVQEPLL